MIRLQCEACGASELKKSGDLYICEFCGSRYFIDSQGGEEGSVLTEARVIALLEEANRLHENKQYTAELKVLVEALALDENNSIIMVHLGRCCRTLNNPDKALEFYDKAIELNPYEGTAYTNMGTIYLLRCEYENAKQCYDKGLPLIDKCEFDYWLAQANYAVAIAKLGDPERAERMISEAEARGYSNGDVIRKMAGIKKRTFFSRLFG